MKNEKLRELLSKGLELEENYIGQFAPFILTALTESELPTTDLKEITRMVQHIESESQRHKKEIENILRSLKK